MLLLAIGFAVGVLLSRSGISGPHVAIGAVATIAAIYFVWRDAVHLFLPLLFIALGAICHEAELGSVAPNRIKHIYTAGKIESFSPVEIEGVLIGFPEPAAGGSFMTVRVEKLTFQGTETSASGNVRLFVLDDEDLKLRHGSIIRVACRLEREDRFLNPGVTSRIEMLDQQGIDATATVKSPRLIEKLGDDSVFLPLSWAYESRLRLIAAFRVHLSPQTAGVMTASLLGDKHFLDRDTAELFREGGTFHVLVISGLHITVIGGLTLWFVSLFTRRVVWQSMLAAGFLWAYTFAVGADIPVVRASVMFTLLLLSRLFYRQGSLLNALGTCTLMLLVWRPSDLFSASFQLTFVSVAAIVGCAFPLIEKLRAIGSWSPSRESPLPPNVGKTIRRLCELLYWNEEDWRIRSRREIWSAGLFKSTFPTYLASPTLKAAASYMFEGLIVSLIVQAWMLPFVVIYFHRVPPAGLILNLWVGVFLALESFTAIAAVTLAAFSTWLAAPVICLTELLNTLMVLAPQAVSSLEVMDVRIPTYAGALRIVYVVYFGGIVLVSTRAFRWNAFSLAIQRAGRGRSLLAPAATVALGLIIVFHPFSSPVADGYLRIDFLDVGQGDSALITFPDGQTMLVDGGGQVRYRGDNDADFDPDVPRIGELVVSEFLWEKGYSRIDYLVGTHADADHIQGLVDVAENFEVGTVLLGDVNGNDPDLVALLTVANRKKIEVQTVNRGDSISIAGVDIQILHPSAEPGRAGQRTNDRSVVLRLTIGARTFLLTGDIEREAELEVASSWALLGSDVVKVPHHGSRTSSTDDLVQRVSAGTAVISVGRRSRFGHPHPEVVQRWRAAGAEVITTGERGTITVKTDGEGLKITTFLP